MAQQLPATSPRASGTQICKGNGGGRKTSGPETPRSHPRTPKIGECSLLRHSHSDPMNDVGQERSRNLEAQSPERVQRSHSSGENSPVLFPAAPTLLPPPGQISLCILALIYVTLFSDGEINPEMSLSHIILSAVPNPILGNLTLSFLVPFQSSVALCSRKPGPGL